MDVSNDLNINQDKEFSVFIISAFFCAVIILHHLVEIRWFQIPVADGPAALDSPSPSKSSVLGN